MVQAQERCVLYVCTKFEADGTIRSKVIRGPKTSKLGYVTQVPGHAHLRVFLWSTRRGCVLYACTKFEAFKSYKGS